MKSNYSPDTEERAFIEDISQHDKFSFEEMSDSLKTFSQSVIEVENMTLKNKMLLGGWIAKASECLDVKICAEKIYQVDLMIGCLENVK